jgi:dienelactone hydrolase
VDRYILPGGVVSIVRLTIKRINKAYHTPARTVAITGRPLLAAAPSASPPISRAADVRMFLRSQLLAVATTLLCALAHAEIVEETLRYALTDEITAEGFIVYDTEWTSAPGVLIVHQWQGLGTTEQQHARDLARRGMVGFAADLYGEGCRGQPCGPQMAGFLREHPVEMRARAQRSLQVLTDQAFVNGAQVGANGYCFGGTVVLEMARASMPLAGVVSFHGGLLPLIGDTTIPQDIAVQVHTGDLDPITANELGAGRSSAWCCRAHLPPRDWVGTGSCRPVLTDQPHGGPQMP